MAKLTAPQAGARVEFSVGHTRGPGVLVRHAERHNGELRFKDGTGLLLSGAGPRDPTLPMTWLTWIQLQGIQVPSTVHVHRLSWSDGHAWMLRKGKTEPVDLHTVIVEWSWE